MQIRSNMVRHGWRLQKIGEMPDVWVQNNLVTPYWHIPRIRRKPDGSYELRGLIGVLHRKFEDAWISMRSVTGSQQVFACSILTFHFPDLHKRSFAEPGPQLEAQVREFCSAIVDFLGDMPTNEFELAASFKNDVLCGKPVRSFAGEPDMRKFLAFEQFVRDLPTGHRRRLPRTGS